MDKVSAPTLRIGAWCVNPIAGEISREGETVRVEARAMRLLLRLANRPGEIISNQELLEQVWPEVVVSPDSVYHAVASLRRLLGDDPKKPTYIATVPRLGYRIVATVTPWIEQSVAAAGTGLEFADTEPSLTRTDAPTPSWRIWTLLIAGLAFGLLLAVAYSLKRGNNIVSVSTPIAARAQNSVAVLPFLDLTSESMDQEYLADGMTEAMIDRLSQIPGFHVPPPTSSFNYKGKKVAVADIARALGVAYVLDGSLRKSGPTLRIAARLVRADSGFVVWSETIDTRTDDMLRVQDDIAEEVAKALRASLDAARPPAAAH
jgi:TolB-like protein/DNA-binding winged helix-turn-helix (wHTH) protein